MRNAVSKAAFLSISECLLNAAPRSAGALLLSAALVLGGCHDSSDDDEVPVVIIGDGNSGHVRYLDTFSYDAHRLYFYQEVAGKYEPETVSVWVFPNESSLLVVEHQLDGYSNRISVYARVVVFDERTGESEMMAWLDDDLAGFDFPVQPESETWIDHAVDVDSLTYHDTYPYGDRFVDEYEVQYHVDGVSIADEFVLYGFDDFELVLAQYDL